MPLIDLRRSALFAREEIRKLTKSDALVPANPCCWPISSSYSGELCCQFSEPHSKVLGPAIYRIDFPASLLNPAWVHLPKLFEVPLTMRRTFTRVWIFLLATASLLSAQAVIPGKFYEYYTVASTQAGTFTALGPPSINDNGLCAFTGTTAAGQTIWVSDGDLISPRDINPGQANLGRNFFDPQLQINTNNQVVAKDFIPGTSQNIRVWAATATDSFVFLARAGTSQPYTALNGAPAINANGDGVFGAVNGTTHELVEVSGGVSHTFGINNSAPEPAIAANGSMVVTTFNAGLGLNQVILFTNNFASQTTIASATNFSYLDTAPGISDDGNVVVFQGNLTPAGVTNLGITGGAGPGIFAAVNTGSAWQTIRITGLMIETPGSGGNNDGICDPGETCKNAAELGYDDNNNSINFASYPTNTRVAVANNDFGAAGIADDTFVISFMGTPSHASRTNPVTKNGPLLFSGNTGLWTIRVDAEHQLTGTNALVFHPYTAIPVVQVGDQLGTNNIVTALSVNMQIANAAEDEFGTDRTMRRGDHRIAFQATMNGSTQTIFRANHLDSSQDGILDHWKTTGIDMDQDGFVDLSLSAMGAVVGQRDLFVEMDWLSDQPGYNFHPAPGVISDWSGNAGFLPAMLASAPALAGNMYGVRRDGTAPATIPAGITMHIDGGPGLDFDGQPFSYNMGSGPLNGGDQIGMSGNNTALVEILYFGAPGSINLPGVNTRAFQDAKDNFFGSLDKDARELAFKYAVLADHFEFIDSPPANHPISGAGSNFILVGDPYPAGGVKSGNFIKITAGTGAGETVRITGFDTTILNKMYVAPFTTVPDTSSTFAYLSGSTGNSEVFFYPSPDNNSLPGDDFILSLGDQAVNPEGYLMNACDQWRTLAHEMGHTLGLRHGGIDHTPFNANYMSLMSYSYQLNCNGISPVQGYSGATDPVFDDFANLNHQFAEVFFHAGNTLGTGYGGAAESTQQVPEQNYQDYINQNGPVDLVKPVIAITSPAAGSQVGSSLTVTIQATDNVAVTSVKASFDANGDGILSPTEVVTAVPAGGNLYTATFSSVSGSLSPRTLTAIAFDSSGNSGKTSISLNVGTQTQFALSVSLAGTGSGSVTSSPSGISCPTTCSANYNSGTPVTLTATAGTGSTFAGWSGACTGTGSCSVTMSAAKAVTATFNTVQFALTVTEAGTGSGTVTSSPSGISCPTTCSANYNSGTPVTLTAAAGTGSTFAGWSGACTGTGTCSVTMSAAKAVTATFNTVQFALTVTEAGTGTGTVTSSPSGISCPTTCSTNYNSGTPVTLTATAGTGSTFAGWSGACTGTGTCSVTMSAAQSVTATFNTTPVQFALTVTEAGTGSGSVTSSPTGISCPSTCSANYNSGTPVTLTATAGSGSTFAGWSGACTGTGTCSVTMSAAKSVTATFNTVQFALTVTEAGTGSGTVTSSPAGISCPTTCSANYNSGTPVTLTATAGTGSTFAGWSGACSGTGTCQVTMSAAQSVTATFNTIPVQFALTVSEAGTGTGTVTSSPTGINCPTTCSANYNSGTPVTLTATAGTGSTFAGWSGACTGTGSCSVTMSAAQSVTATFNSTPVQFALTVTEAGTGTGTVTSSPSGINCPSTCSANYNSGTPVTLTATRRHRFNLRWLERSLLGHRKLLGDDERGEGGDGDIQHCAICLDGDGSGNRQRHRQQQSIWNQLPVDLFSKLQQRHSGDIDGDGRNGLNLCRMERGVFGYRKLFGDDERGTVGNCDVQFHASAICSDGDRSRSGKRHGNE